MIKSLLIACIMTFNFVSMAKACEYGRIKYSIYPDFKGVDVDSTKSRSFIHAQNNSKVISGLQIQGLTKVRFQSSIKNSIRISRVSGGLWCATVSDLRINIGLSDKAKVYIASEIPRNSCLYNAVLQHEMEHVSIAKEGLDSIFRNLPGKLNIRLDGASRTGRNKKQIVKDMNAYVDAVVSGEINNYIREIEINNSKIDTRESYLSFRKQCS